MEMRVSAKQLFSAIVLVPYGSAVLFFINPETKQDAWIAIIIYILPGILLQIIYTYLWSKYPSDTIVSYMPKIFGKIIGNILSILYIVFFEYEASRVLRDMIELLKIAAMPKLSPILIGFILMLVIGYGAYLGLENICRAAHSLLYLGIFFTILEWILLLLTPEVLKFYNLKPMLEMGIVPIIKKSWKLITFPYGESIVLAMFFSNVVETSRVRKAAVLGIILLGLLMSINTIMFITVLGVDYASASLFPLLQTLRIIKVGETFDRMDIFIILIMIMAGFIKVSFFMYASMLGTNQLIKTKNMKFLAIPFSILLLILSQIIARNYPQHIYVGQVLTLTYIHLPLAIIIPIVAALICLVRRK